MKSSKVAKALWRNTDFVERWTASVRKGVKKICQNCGKEFWVPMSRENAMFCSRRCYDEYRVNQGTRKVKVRCQNCGKEFKAIRWVVDKAGRKFCSRECYWESMRDEKVLVTCLNCGKEFEVDKERANSRKFCSVECRKEYNKKKTIKIRVQCINCGKEFEVSPYKVKQGRGKFCSRECYYVYVKTNEEHRRKVSEELRKRWQDPVYKEKVSKKIRLVAQDPGYREKKVRRTMEALQIKPNRLEKAFCDLLQSYFLNEWQYVGDGKIFIAGFVPDFIHREKKWVIEVNGDYWHSFSEAVERDRKKRRAYERCGYKVLEVWESEVKQDPLAVVNNVMEHFYSDF
jgi:very-short-patch-repair endonuclease/endogenous inhibitor of DNA gyrase (YacG/DUF329 family)